MCEFVYVALYVCVYSCVNLLLVCMCVLRAKLYSDGDVLRGRISGQDKCGETEGFRVEVGLHHGSAL